MRRSDDEEKLADAARAHAAHHRDRGRDGLAVTGMLSRRASDARSPGAVALATLEVGHRRRPRAYDSRAAVVYGFATTGEDPATLGSERSTEQRDRCERRSWGAERACGGVTRVGDWTRGGTGRGEQDVGFGRLDLSMRCCGCASLHPEEARSCASTKREPMPRAMIGGYRLETARSSSPPARAAFDPRARPCRGASPAEPRVQRDGPRRRGGTEEMTIEPNRRAGGSDTEAYATGWRAVASGRHRSATRWSPPNTCCARCPGGGTSPAALEMPRPASARCVVLGVSCRLPAALAGAVVAARRARERRKRSRRAPRRSDRSGARAGHSEGREPAPGGPGITMVCDRPLFLDGLPWDERCPSAHILAAIELLARLRWYRDLFPG